MQPDDREHTQISTTLASVRARVKEDEEIARGASCGPLQERWRAKYHRVTQRGYGTDGRLHDGPIAECHTLIGRFPARHIARHDPVRVLEDVEATRAILAIWERENAGRHTCAEGEARAWLMDEVVQALAQPPANSPPTNTRVEPS